MTLNSLPNSFIDESQKIDQEALRVYTYRELTDMRQHIRSQLDSPIGLSFGQALHQAILNLGDDPDKGRYLRVESQLKGIPRFIDSWINTAIDSSERLDFFVRSKAAEIASGDEKHDYYWAVRIRHDQLVALIRVLKHLIGHIDRFLNMPPIAVLDDPVFQGMLDYSIEDQVFLEAEKVHKERESVN